MVDAAEKTSVKASQNTPADVTPDVEALSHLHKMSRTAGLGDTNYVAINAMAVTSLIFGIASALVVFDPIFLAIPLVAIVFAILSIRQVRRSCGTQTGKGLSILAIVIALLFTGLLGSKQVMKMVGHNLDEAAIADLVKQYGTKVASKDYDAAYKLMSDSFQQRVGPNQFVAPWLRFEESPELFGHVKSMEGGQFVAFDIDSRTEEQLARSNVLFVLDNPQHENKVQELLFRKQGDRWLIENFPAFYPIQVQVKSTPISPTR